MLHPSLHELVYTNDIGAPSLSHSSKCQTFRDTLRSRVERWRKWNAQKCGVVATSVSAATCSVARRQRSRGDLNCYGAAKGQAVRIRMSLWSSAQNIAAVIHLLAAYYVGGGVHKALVYPCILLSRSGHTCVPRIFSTSKRRKIEILVHPVCTYPFRMSEHVARSRSGLPFAAYLPRLTNTFYSRSHGTYTGRGRVNSIHVVTLYASPPSDPPRSICASTPTRVFRREYSDAIRTGWYCSSRCGVLPCLQLADRRWVLRLSDNFRAGRECGVFR